MDRQAILDRLCAEAPALREGSDVDVPVRFQGKADFDRFMGLKLDLEDRLQRPVDLGTPDTLRAEMRAHVEKDLIRVS